jgi:hypothetical protein
MWDSKRSKLKIKFKPCSNPCWILTNLTSDRCFIQNLSCRGQNQVILTSIPFYTYMERKIKKERGWKSQPSKTSLAFCQFWPSTISTWISWVREVYLMQTHFFLDFKLKDLSYYQMEAEKELIWNIYDFSKTIYKLCQQTSFMKKHVKLT